MKFKDSALAHKLLDNLSGVEIGASAHNPFNLPGCRVNVDYTDDMNTIFKQEERNICGEAAKVDVVAFADSLPFADGEWDYVITSHVAEHLYDAIKGVKEWMRVIKPGGYVFAIIPHKERTFDRDRPRTTLAELIRRHTEPDPEEAKRDAHHCVWITEDGVELFKYCGLEIVEVQDVDDKVGNGFTIVGRKP